MVKRIFALILALLMVTALFVGCGSDKNEKATNDSEKVVEENKSDTPDTQPKEKEAEPVTIKFIQNSANGGREDVLKSMIDNFQTKYSNITVDYEIIPWNDYYTKLNTVLSAGAEAPDVFEVGYENFAQYASKGLLKDITDIVASDSEFKTENMKKLAFDAYKFDGKQMGICTDFTGCIMYYNKDLFDSKGLEYPNENWTWEDELEAAKKLTDESKGIWGTVSPLQVYEFYKTIAQNGGSVWGTDGKTVTVNSKECVEALQWMIDKSYKYKVQPPFTSDIYTQPDADWRAFEEGKIAMLRNGTWQFGEFEKNAKCNWDIVLEPGNTQKAHHFFSNGLAMYKNSEKGNAAWTFMKYMAIDPFVVNTRIEENWNIPVLNDDNVMSAYYKKTPPESKKVATDLLDSLVLPPLGPIPEKWAELQQVLGEELEKAKYGKVTAQEALDAAKEKIEKLLQ
ncbi:MAG TPA: sugar ABC transporter substrate-binding protein [Clostridiaceae bacterium]|nr:sugar ABC transporter substrate-binding protein [Clostridiaceae bacterium]HHV99098.1 sugar ABC transporter substrate-binding protein [Clostridiaceae bacterium]